MNVLILTTHLNIGGIPRYVINLAKALSGEGNNVFVASSKGVWEDDIKGIKNTYFMPLSINTKSIISPKVISSLFKLIPLVKSQDIQIVHANTRVTQFLAYLLSKITKVPFISTFHGCYKPHCFRKLFKLTGLRAIAVSGFVKKHLIFRLGISSQKIVTIYNGVELNSDFKKEILESEKEVLKDIVKGEPVIGMITRLSKEKNVSLIIRSMPLILKRYPKAKVIILGQGREETDLKNQVKRLNLEENIVFLEGLLSESVFSFLDVFVSLTLGEPFGLSVVEAQVCKVPVAVVPSGALKETVVNKVTGLVFKDFKPQSIVEGISEIIENKEFRDRMVINALKRVKENFTTEIMGKRTYKLYREVLDLKEKVQK